MSKIYLQLIEDHVHLTQLIETLRCEVAGYDQEDWYQPNLPLILETLNYIRVYPEVFHHPLEEHVFDYLVEHGLVDREVVAAIVSQHDEMEEATEQLQEQFNELADSIPASIDALRESLDHYLDLQLLHLATENEKIFPTIATLGDGAWGEISHRLAIHHTPLFSDHQDKAQFTGLIESLKER